MSREEIRELAALYAVGGLDGEDVARFEALLRARDAEATSALREFETAWFGWPASTLNRRRLGQGGAGGAHRRRAAAPPGRAPAPPARVRSRVWPAVWGAAMAAGIAAIAVGLTVSASYEKRLTPYPGGGRAEGGHRAPAAVSSPWCATRTPRSGRWPARRPLPRPARGCSGTRAPADCSWPPGSARIPPARPISSGRSPGQNPPISAGVFTVDAKGTASLRVPPLPGVKKVDAFAVTLEPAGGRPAPTGQMFLAGKS